LTLKRLALGKDVGNCKSTFTEQLNSSILTGDKIALNTGAVTTLMSQCIIGLLFNGIDRSVGDLQFSISFTFKLSTIVDLQLPWAIP